jgi:hypothetical protein
VLASAHGDSLLFDADTLRAHVPASLFGRVESEAQAHVVKLANGDSLRLDAKTPAGDFDLADRRRITVTAGIGYPRVVRYRSPPTRALTFRVRTAGRVGMLVASGADSRWSDAVSCSLYAVWQDSAGTYPGGMSGWVQALPEHVRAAALEVPSSWFEHGTLELALDRATPLGITWIAFDRLPGDGSPSPAVPADHVRATGRVIGRMVVDPRRGGVVLRE